MPIRGPRSTCLKRTWWLSLLVLAVAVAAACGAAGALANGASASASGADRAQDRAHPSKARARSRATVSRAVTFTVQNVNRSKLPCTTDGVSYQVKGHIVGPRSALGKESRRRKPAATLYLHGLGFGELFWTFNQIPGYDYAAALARAGHVSVVIDRLGYETGARDVSLALVKNSGHAVTVEREAATFRKKLSRWLARRGF